MKTLFLAWQDPDSRAWFPIGRLTFDGTEYQFAFPDLNKVYKSTELFPLFSNLTFHVKSWKVDENRVLAKVNYGRYSG